MTRIFVFSLLLFTVFISHSFAGFSPLTTKKGGASYDELKLPGHPRNSALAGSGTAHPQSADEISNSPLALSYLTSYFITATTTSPPSQIGVSVHSVHSGTHLNAFNLAFGGRYVKYDELQGYDIFDQKTSKYSARSFHISSILSNDSARIRWAAAIHYGFKAIDQFSSHAFYLSAAANIAITPKTHVALSVLNVGYSTSMNTKEMLLPATFICSFAHIIPVTKRVTTETFFDLKKINEESLHPIIGEELSLFGIAFIRGGYNFHPDQSWAIGGGIHVSSYRIQYAYQNHTELNGFHSTSIGIHF